MLTSTREHIKRLVVKYREILSISKIKRLLLSTMRRISYTPSQQTSAAKEEASKRRRTLLFGDNAHSFATPAPVATSMRLQAATVRDLRQLDPFSVARLLTSSSTVTALTVENSRDFFGALLTRDDDGTELGPVLTMHTAATDSSRTATFTMPLMLEEWRNGAEGEEEKLKNTQQLLHALLFGSDRDDSNQAVFCFAGKTLLKHLLENGWLPKTAACA